MIEVAVAYGRCMSYVYRFMHSISLFWLLNDLSIFCSSYKYFRFSPAMLDLTVQNNASRCRSMSFVYVLVYIYIRDINICKGSKVTAV